MTRHVLRRLVMAGLLLFTGLCPFLQPWAGAANISSVLPSKGWVSLEQVAGRCGLSVRMEGSRRIVCQNRVFMLIFEENSRRMVFNGVSIYLNSEIRRWGPQWMLTAADAQGIILPLMMPGQTLSSVGHRLVVLDPGHGGEDPGASGYNRTPEKKLTLDIAKRVRYKLRDTGISVMLTRERDRTLSLDSRVKIATQYRADLFVSIHLNSSVNRTVSGFETFMVPAEGYATTAAPASRSLRYSAPARCPGNLYTPMNAVLAYYLQKGLVSYGDGQDRGIRQARYYVIRNAPCPAALVECGYLSHRREGILLTSEEHRDRVAEGIARGIMTYLSRAREFGKKP